MWKLRNSRMVIPAELHEKILQSCTPINDTSSEVLAVRHAPVKKMKPVKKTFWKKILD